MKRLFDDSGLVMRELTSFGSLERNNIMELVKSTIAATGSGVLCWCWDRNRADGRLAYVTNVEASHSYPFKTLTENEETREYANASPVTAAELTRIRRKEFLKCLMTENSWAVVGFAHFVLAATWGFSLLCHNFPLAIAFAVVDGLVYLVRSAIFFSEQF